MTHQQPTAYGKIFLFNNYITYVFEKFWFNFLKNGNKFIKNTFSYSYRLVRNLCRLLYKFILIKMYLKYFEVQNWKFVYKNIRRKLDSLYLSHFSCFFFIFKCYTKINAWKSNISSLYWTVITLHLFAIDSYLKKSKLKKKQDLIDNCLFCKLF